MAKGMKVQSATLENEPGSVGDAIKRLSQTSESITEQSTNACWGNNPPACLFDHQDKRAVG